MLAVTQAGPYLLVGVIALRWFSVTNRHGVRHLTIQCGLATALSLFLNQLLLLGFHRVRPYEMGVARLLIGRSQDPSFPPDHATLVLAITTILTLRRDAWTIPILVFAVGICVSRVFVGTHFVSDVLGGAVTGVAGAFIVDHFYPRLEAITERLVRVL